jgi:hypothetical protein
MLFNDRHAQSTALQSAGHGQADHSTTDDSDIYILHVVVPYLAT